MKLVLFQSNSSADIRPGVLTDGGVVDISSAVKQSYTPQMTMQGIIDAFDSLRSPLERLARDGTPLPLDKVRLRPPLPRPGKILACIANYWEHAQREPRPLNMFMKNPDAVIGPGDTIMLPEFTVPWMFMHEAELALVIKGPSKMIKAKDWKNAVFGYTAMIDVSAREQGRRTWPASPLTSWLGKSFDTFAPIGPCIATADEIEDPNNLIVRFWNDGQLRHNYNTDDMEHRVPELIEFATTVMTMNSGDLIACGTNHEGLGALQDGETVEIEIQNISKMALKVSDSLKRKWERGIYMGVDSTNPDAVKRHRPQGNAQHSPEPDSMNAAKSEIRDGMQIDWDVPITMDDGVVLRADLFRPAGGGAYPVILSYGPYAKGLSFQEGYKGNWARLIKAAPEVLEGSSNKYQNWELVDPEKWVPDGYACLRIDSRGAGRSPGYLDVWSVREAQDLYQCVEWAGTQSWSNGKVGINGISYYAMNQWQVGALRPPHLAAMCIWEGSSDYYRELCRHGGILSDFLNSWHPRQVASVQHGVGTRGAKSVVTGEPVAGPETLPQEELAKNCADTPGEAKQRRLCDDYYAARTAEFEKIEAPLLSAGNWGGMGLHTRGNFEGYLRAGSRQKWLEVHGDTHFTHFYSRYGEALQKRFFGHFLKGEDTGWNKQARVSLNIRHPNEKFVLRAENEWPLARTKWTKYFLRPDHLALATEAPTSATALSYETTGDGLTFRTPALTRTLEITGPVAAKLWISSETTDADLFLVLRVFDPAGKEVTFIGSNDPRVPVGLGWLRASHRKLDPAKSFQYRPWHTHDEEWPLKPGEPVELDVEIWPTSIVIPPGHQFALTIRGKDYEVDGTDVALPNAPYSMKGVGPFLHIDKDDRPPAIFSTRNSIHFAAGKEPYLLLPVIPEG